jgi:predicted nucleic acid-binding protein
VIVGDWGLVTGDWDRVGGVDGFGLVGVLVDGLAGMPNKLHRGESSCLAIAEVRKWLFLSDDMAARKEARRRGITISGTLDYLVLAIEHDIYSLGDANLWLHRMMEMGYHCPVSDLSSFVLHK